LECGEKVENLSLVWTWPLFNRRKIILTGKKFLLEDEIEWIGEGVVKRIGNGAMILSSKNHIGKKVYVLVRK
jgi:putative transposon-encoded protein